MKLEGMIKINGAECQTAYKPLWWHTAGKSQTASGYGRKLTTASMVHYNGRWHRIYVCCYSNSGTAYIVSKGEWIIVS